MDFWQRMIESSSANLGRVLSRKLPEAIALLVKDAEEEGGRYPAVNANRFNCSLAPGYGKGMHVSFQWVIAAEEVDGRVATHVMEFNLN